MSGSTSTKTALLFNDGGLSGDFRFFAAPPTGLTVDAGGCAAVPAGSACVVSFTYAPTGMQAFSASGIAPQGVTTSNALSVIGQGLQTKVDLSTGSLTFASRETGSVSPSQSVLVTNSGNAAASLGALTVTGPFSATTTCGGALAANGSCTINVTFQPITAGTLTGTVSLGSGASAQTVSLTGTATNPTVSTFTDGDFEWAHFPTSKVEYTTAANDCGLSLNGTTGWRLPTETELRGLLSSKNQTYLSGQGWPTGAQDYFWTTTPFSGGGRVALTTAQGYSFGQETGTLVYAACLRPYGASFKASTNADFGTVTIGTSATRTFTYTALGGAYSNVRATLTGSDLTLSSNTCGTSASPVSLAQGASCSVTVQYTPTTATALSSASIRVDSTAPNSPHSLGLAGTGQVVDPSFASVSTLLHFDSSATPLLDSASKTAWSATGSVVRGADVYGTTGGGSFTSGSVVLSAAGTPLEMSTGDFTVEAWIKPNDFTGLYPRIFSYNTSATAGPLTGGGFDLAMQKEGLTNPTVNSLFYWCLGGSGGCTNFVSFRLADAGGTFSWTSWHHVVIQRRGGYAELYIDGKKGSYVNGTNLYTTNLSLGKTMYVGRDAAGAGAIFPGLIDEVRVTKGLARYTGAFSVPTAPFPNQ